jgi:general secretion pathway protein I
MKGIMARVHTPSDGFTLLEVLVAMAILATAFVILLEAHGASIRISDNARRLTVASALARDVMTEFEMNGFPEIGHQEGDFEEWYPTMYPEYSWEIEVIESMFWGNVREIYAKVIWIENGEPREVEIANFVAAMNEEEQDFAASTGSGGVGNLESMMGAYEDAAAGTKGGEMAGGGL